MFFILSQLVRGMFFSGQNPYVDLLGQLLFGMDFDLT